MSAKSLLKYLIMAELGKKLFPIAFFLMCFHLEIDNRVFENAN